MKTKEMEQLKNKPDAELLNEIKKSKDKLWELQVDLRAGKTKNASEIANLKKLIARMNTAISERKNTKTEKKS
ncbi:MAG: 50S ribosomal protein L29 [Patescibacteria group bacterium]|nr:50S ribosomal protein L29 [Patescibacteria group bacterium]